VKIIEVDAERRRLSLSLKRIEDGEAQPLAEGDEPLRPQIDLSEEVFADSPAAEAAVEAVADEEPQAEAVEPEAQVEPEAVEPEARVEPEAQVEPEAHAESEPAEPEPADEPAASDQAS
jgi:hypothetical protein